MPRSGVCLNEQLGRRGLHGLPPICLMSGAASDLAAAPRCICNLAAALPGGARSLALVAGPQGMCSLTAQLLVDITVSKHLSVAQ